MSIRGFDSLLFAIALRMERTVLFFHAPRLTAGNAAGIAKLWYSKQLKANMTGT